MSKLGVHLAAVAFVVFASVAAMPRAEAQQATPLLSPDAAVATYCTAWNTTDSAERECLLARVWAPDGAYSDPDTTPTTGRAALSDAITTFQHGHPGVRFRCSVPQVHHGAMRTAWIAVGPDGKELWHGTDFGELAADGRIRRVVGFFGDAPVVRP